MSFESAFIKEYDDKIYPARFMASSTVWIAIASMIAVFDIKKAVDPGGNVVELSHETYPNHLNAS